jgi:hypothetical protein
VEDKGIHFEDSAVGRVAFPRLEVSSAVVS